MCAAVLFALGSCRVGCCRALCLVLEPNLANQIAARVTLVNKNGVKESLEDGEGGGALYHGYVEGEGGGRRGKYHGR